MPMTSTPASVGSELSGTASRKLKSLVKRLFVGKFGYVAITLPSCIICVPAGVPGLPPEHDRGWTTGRDILSYIENIRNYKAAVRMSHCQSIFHTIDFNEKSGIEGYGLRIIHKPERVLKYTRRRASEVFLYHVQGLVSGNNFAIDVILLPSIILTAIT